MGGGCLQKVPNIVISLTNFWYFGKLDAEERWSLTKGGVNRGCDCSTQKKTKQNKKQKTKKQKTKQRNSPFPKKSLFQG